MTLDRLLEEPPSPGHQRSGRVVRLLHLKRPA
jgi:hypothetical protein